MKMSAKRVLGLVLTGILAAGPLTTYDEDGTAVTAADTEVEATTAAGDAKAESDAAADTAAAGSGEEKTLRAAMECVYAPYNWTQPDDSSGVVAIADSNEFTYGYDVMVTEEVCEGLGYDLEIVRLDQDSLIPAVTTGQVDCITAGQSATSERLQVAGFTESYYYAIIVTLVKEGNKYADVKSVADLAGVTYTSQQNIIWYNTCLPQTQDANALAATASTPGVSMSLNAGRCDLIVADQPTGKGALVTYPNFEMIESDGGNVDFQVTNEGINIDISLRKGNIELKDAINSVLTKMTKGNSSGVIDEVISI